MSSIHLQKKIMRLIALLGLLIIFQSCDDSSSTLSFNGNIPGAEDGSRIYFQKINQNNQPYDIDTIEIRNGKFSFEIEKNKHTQLGLLNFRNLNTSVLFFYDKKNIEGEFDLNRIYDAKITGGKENDLFLDFKEKLELFDRRKKENLEAMQEARNAMSNKDIVRLQTEAAVISNEEQVYKKEFIDKNINSLLAMLLLNEMIVKKEVNIKEVESFLSKRNSKIPDNVFMKQIETNSERLRVPEVGNMAPDFSGPDPDGNIISLQEVMGKVTLIDFWASWCRPCRVENPNVVRVYNQFKDKGFTVVSISLDRENQRAQWLKAIEDDKMDWYHISSLMHWQEPIARQYGVRQIPMTYLLDETGKIVASNLRGPALGQKVSELLGNQ